jgi:hypothetical protein
VTSAIDRPIVYFEVSMETIYCSVTYYVGINFRGLR